MNQFNIEILAAIRTPLGNFQGELKSLSATQLGSHAISAALQQAQLDVTTPQSVIMGCVLPAGLGQAPARQASIHAGLPPSIGCTTINKVCGSGMKAAMIAHDSILAGSYDVMVVGGMESMTNAPYLLPKARQGYRLGHQTALDHMFFDGLEDAYEPGRLMGTYAEQCAEKYHFTREQQDEFALTSLERAKKADFSAEIAPIEIKGIVIDSDEGPRIAKPEKIPLLKPAFKKDGTITAANSSSITDGAAALIIAKQGATNTAPIARLIAHSTHSQASEWFTTAPIGAIQQLLQKTGWSLSDVDLFEINEAFAVVTMVAIEELGLPADKVNVNGGACVLGHPLGATGARIIVTLIHALKQRNLKRGIAALCIGGGEATAVAIELC